MGALGCDARADVDATWRQSGNLYTASASAHAVDATLALVGAILGEKQARQVAEAMGFPLARPSKVAVPTEAPAVAIVEKA